MWNWLTTSIEITPVYVIIWFVFFFLPVRELVRLLFEWYRTAKRDSPN